MYFGVRICKANRSAAMMVHRRKINPHILLWGPKSGVIDAIRVFIQKNIRFGRNRVEKL
jgi:hypothetical protein